MSSILAYRLPAILKAMPAKRIVIIAHNIRSTHNVGSLLRTAEGLAVENVYFTGYTPYPRQINENRLPHIVDKLQAQIQKTALGAELSQPSEVGDIHTVLTSLRDRGFELVALEQAAKATLLPNYKTPSKVALLLGSEVEGVATDLLQQMDKILEIPMFGNKESFNVIQAAAMALYHCRFVR